MLKTEEERAQRQFAMRQRIEERDREETAQADLLTIAEAARLLRVSITTARHLFRGEPGVHRLRTPGSQRMMLRIPRSVIERILRRTANPF